MIRNTFIILNSLSYKKEINLWKSGIKDWNDFVNKDKISGISQKRKLVYNYQLYQAKRALLNNNSEYFAKLLPKKDHWRTYELFKDSCIFLDIETSCVNQGYISCITLYDGYETKTFVKDHNLDFNIIKNILSKSKMIITFNGNVFDLPFLKKYYKNLIPDVPCWDLRHSCANLELNGGLKQVEKKLNIKRNNKIVDRLHGGDPLKLWKMYLGSENKYYLDLLIEYNQEDTINLKIIADKIYQIIKSKLQDNFPSTF
jgi:uncharacterized protein